MSTLKPSPTGDNGRRLDGRFGAGNRFAKGNPMARRAQRLRVALFRAVGPDDLTAIVRTLVELAKAGDIMAAREVLERTLGRPVEHDLIARIEALEDANPRNDP